MLKTLISPILQRLARWYLAKERTYHYEGLKIQIPPGVFHPGLFFSTHILLRRLLLEKPVGKSILELGAGSGLISMVIAKAGSNVLATDINPLAIENLKRNAASNQVILEILESDLFDNIPTERHFDYILINPPFYPKAPKSMAGRAWYCGENFEYFEKLFQQLQKVRASQIWMILSEDCDLYKISKLAEKNNLKLKLIHGETNFWERNSIFSILKDFNPGNS